MTKLTNQLAFSLEFDHMTASAAVPHSCKQPENYGTAKVSRLSHDIWYILTGELASCQDVACTPIGV